MFTELKKRFSRSLKKTACFYPVDLHLHSHVSPDCNVEPREMVVAACNAGLSIIAGTDHNRADNVPLFVEAAEDIRKAGENLYPNNNLIVLPGIEITVEENNKNVHVLGIFPENTDWAQIEMVLDDTGLEFPKEKRTQDSKVSRKRLVEIIDRIHDRRGLAVLAHINTDNGYRYEMRKAGKSDEDILQNIVEWKVDAVEVSKAADSKHFVYGQKEIPCVVSSDAHSVEEIGAKEHITRVKMTKPSFEDLVRALKDPRTRIRYEDESATGFKRILGIDFSGGFLDGQCIGFSPNLNCLIGGRGTGKSTLIEAIRYVFDCPVPLERERDIETMREQVLKGCTITLIFEDNFGEEYVLKRIYGEPQCSIMNLQGVAQQNIDVSQSNRLRVNVFGWSEIERIAKDSSQQLELIDGFIEKTSHLKQDEQAILQELRINATDISNELSTIQTQKTRVGNLAELKEELSEIGEEATPEEIRKAMADTEATLATTIKTTFQELLKDVADIGITDIIKEVNSKIKEARDGNTLISPGIFDDILRLTTKAIEESDSTSKFEKAVQNPIISLQKQIDQKLADLKPIHEEIRQKFTELFNNLQHSKTRQLAERREYLRGEIRRRQEAQNRLEKSQDKLRNNQNKRRELTANLIRIRKNLYKVRDEHIQAIKQQLPKGKANLDIELLVEEQKNRSDFVKLLKDKLVKLPENWRQRRFPEIIANQFTPIEFADIISNNRKELLEGAEFSSEEVDNLLRHFQDKHQDIMEFESCSCSDLPRILFNVEGKETPIENLSPGQRCTALLPIILLETDTPLIIDQPEDNLDNQFIFDLVVATLRNLKERRQIIVATHNPNIPVSGDAENIVVFQAEGSTGKVKENGSIDYSPVIQSVKSIMEGGEEAFSIRVQKYGFSHS